MKRILIAQPYIAEYRVPLWQRVRNLAAAEGILVDLAAGDPPRRQSQRGDAVSLGDVKKITERELSVAGRRIAFRRLPPLGTYDLIVFEHARRNLDAIWRLSLPNHKVALFGHGKDYVHQAGALSSRLFRHMALRARHYLVYTSGGANQLIQWGVPAKCVTVLGNTTDTARLAALRDQVGDEEAMAFRHELGIPEASTIGLFIGGLDASKRLPFLLDAFERARRTTTTLHLLIAGTGEAQTWLSAQAESKPWLHILGRRTGISLAVAAAASHFIAMPGRVGLVAVDSFALARPIVTTNWPHHAPEFEYLTSGENALIVADDTEAYAQAVNDLAQDGDLFRRLVTGCLASRNEYSIEAMAQRFVAGLCSALAQQHSWR